MRSLVVYLGCVLLIVMVLPAPVLISEAQTGDTSLAAEGPFAYREIWAYLMKGEESYFKGHEPITDVCYFSACINDIGRLDNVIPRPVLAGAAANNLRIHLVINAPANLALMYLCLYRDMETRQALISDILGLARDFDGVQIDFESIRPQERDAFVSFLRDIKQQLPARKILSVALPARMQKQEDAFDYSTIADVADKVVVMAYDEHWRTGTPGPIASMDWCRKIAVFAKVQIPPAKLIMGLPLYGRAWQVEQPAQALKYPQTMELMDTYSKTAGRTQDGTPHFDYQKLVTLSVFYEDLKSLSTKLILYQQLSIQGVGFWRIGQGPEVLWSQLTLAK